MCKQVRTYISVCRYYNNIHAASDYILMTSMENYECSRRISYSGLISRGEIFVDWMVKTFCRLFWMITINRPVNSIKMKIFVIKILKMGQIPQKSSGIFLENIFRRGKSCL